jgi:hemoglobin-like flavoprotein
MSAAALALKPEESQLVQETLTAAQKHLIRESFAKLEPASDLVAALLYLRLFDLDPSLRALFRGDIKPQGRKLMDALKIAILSLDREDGLAPTLKLLGARHRHYGVKAGNYVTFARAFIWTLEQSLEKSFTRDTKEAWVAFYALIMRAMAEQH